MQIKTLITEIVSVIILALVVVLPFRVYVAQPFVVSGDSMDETFHDKDYLIIDEISYRFETPQRGDVIIFKVPPAGLALQNLDENTKIYYIKRLIGLPGETVEINGSKIKIYNEENPEGFFLNEPYIYLDMASKASTTFANLYKKIELKSDEYFVAGDNRYNSADSRLWGTLPEENLRGRALFRILPIPDLSILPGEYNSY